MKYNKSLFLLLFNITILFLKPTKAQISSCVNADFELNSFVNWTGKTGVCCPINCNTPGIVPGRHTIMSGNGKDPNTNDSLSVVAPGGAYSVRLGNSNINSEAEQLFYSFQVDQTNELFIYRYAVVLEDPSHEIKDQPRFQIRVFDQNGDTIECGTYFVYSTSGIPGFITIVNQFGSDVHWKDWTAIGIDLSAYVGQTVTIEFSTGDCGLGAHYGYAYIDCYCTSLSINSDYCPGSTSAKLEAPPGFYSYLWSTGETTSSIIINNPIEGTSYSVKLVSITGCDATLNLTLSKTSMKASFTVTDSCQNSATFKDASIVTNGSAITTYAWNFGDGTFSDQKNPTKIYTTSGTYLINLIIANKGGCLDSFSRTITTLPVKSKTISETICENDSVTIGMQSFYETGNYAIIFKTSKGCDSTINLNLTVNPVDSINFQTSICEGEIINIGNQQFTKSGNYDVIFKNALGCDSVITLDLTVNPLPEINATTNVSLARFEQEVQLDVLSPSLIVSYNWTSDNLLSNNLIRDPTSLIIQSSYFIVKAKNEFNCPKTDSVYIELLNECQTNYVFIPNAFTPNNDGINDCFGNLYITKHSNYKLQIFNRWGDKIFETNQTDGCWDGTNKGNASLVDDYIYILSFRCYNGAYIRKEGIVSLIR